jgi:ketopantoate reductase
MSHAQPVVVVGIGELGGVFARGLLRSGRPVFPITRAKRLADEAARDPAPELVLVTVAEADLDAVLAQMPEPWRDRVGLVQNELLPYVWQAQSISDPTVCVVWFEKKPGRDVHIVQPSLVFGRSAALLVHALAELNIVGRAPHGGEDELLLELVNKNLYILTTNLAGLLSAGTVADLWRKHEVLAREVAHEVLDLQEHLAGATLPRERLLERLEEAIFSDPQHPCTGRSAPARLERAIRHAERAGLDVPRLRAIAAARGAAR